MSNFKYTYVTPQKDERDFVFGTENINASSLSLNSSQINYRIPASSIRIENQSSIGSCTAFAFTTCFEHLVFLLCQDSEFEASPLFNYKQSLILDSVDLSSGNDPGTSLRSAASNGRLCGVPRDTTWPYSLANFSSIPSQAAYDEAFMLSRMFTYFEVNRSRDVMKYVLGDLNFMVMIGFSVFPSYESQSVGQSGNIPVPTDAEIKSGSIGGHAVPIIGWDDDLQVYIIANSYGTTWGNSGYGTLPYAYFENKNLVSEAKLLYPTPDFIEKYTNFKRNIGLRSNPLPSSSMNDKNNFTLYIQLGVGILMLCLIVTLFMTLFKRLR